MFRIVLAAITALALSACGPSAKVDPAKPWDTLLPWNHSFSEIQKLPSGVEYIVLRKGDGKGPFPGPTDRVEVHYDGRLAANGFIFDSSYQRNETATFALNGLIPGWKDGLQKMQPGDMFMFWIPAKEGYGARGAGADIPPNSDIMFQVELVNVLPDPWTKVTPWPTDSSSVVRRPSGLEYMVVESGPAEGASPTENDIAVTNFEGRNEKVDKEEGDTADDIRRRSIVASTFDAGSPVGLPVAGVTSGWNELLKLMRKGDHWMVRMPPALLYGDEGDGRVPPGGTVIYEVKLEDFGPAGGPVAPVAPQ
ncbi:MAG TPA: FKBP-type peptidyl-prolyl cis-trans isomerase [Hyphomonadaceae bacterium]|nr:FKBP-type peptidyl-prolyl cis-trans isomerase [Hyphomonadaceae bacterium]